LIHLVQKPTLKHGLHGRDDVVEYAEFEGSRLIKGCFGSERCGIECVTVTDDYSGADQDEAIDKELGLIVSLYNTKYG
jgi:hypothetical protein